jgi:hypothetical protein
MVTRSSSENMTSDLWVTRASSDTSIRGSCFISSPILATTTGKCASPSGDTSP